jgi:hypothetical protein
VNSNIVSFSGKFIRGCGKKETLKKLHDVHVRMLAFALRNFPSCKRIVYSTGSVYPEENEQVIDRVLSLSESLGYSLVDCSSKFKPGLQVSSADYSFAKKCLSLKYVDDHNKGYFVAMFERTVNKKPKVEKVEEEDTVTEEGTLKRKKKMPEKELDKEEDHSEETINAGRNLKKMKTSNESIDEESIPEEAKIRRRKCKRKSESSSKDSESRKDEEDCIIIDDDNENTIENSIKNISKGNVSQFLKTLADTYGDKILSLFNNDNNQVSRSSPVVRSDSIKKRKMSESESLSENDSAEDYDKSLLTIFKTNLKVMSPNQKENVLKKLKKIFVDTQEEESTVEKTRGKKLSFCETFEEDVDNEQETTTKIKKEKDSPSVNGNVGYPFGYVHTERLVSGFGSSSNPLTKINKTIRTNKVLTKGKGSKIPVKYLKDEINKLNHQEKMELFNEFNKSFVIESS